LNENDIDALLVHGPSQLLRAATLPSCDDKQSRATFEPLAKSDRIDAASV
jgi:hypothetical protein